MWNRCFLHSGHTGTARKPPVQIMDAGETAVVHIQCQMHSYLDCVEPVKKTFVLLSFNNFPEGWGIFLCRFLRCLDYLKAFLENQIGIPLRKQSFVRCRKTTWTEYLIVNSYRIFFLCFLSKSLLAYQCFLSEQIFCLKMRLHGIRNYG